MRNFFLKCVIFFQSAWPHTKKEKGQRKQVILKTIKLILPTHAFLCPSLFLLNLFNKICLNYTLFFSLEKKTPEISNSDFISANPRFFLSFLLTTRVRKHHVIFTNTFRRKGKLRSKEATRPLTYFLFTSSVFVLYKTSQKKHIYFSITMR